MDRFNDYSNDCDNSYRDSFYKNDGDDGLPEVNYLPAKIEQINVSVDVVADEKTINLIEKQKDLKKLIKALTHEVDMTKTHIAVLLNGNDTLIDNDGETLATYKTVKSSRFDVTRLKKENPDLYNNYLQESETKVMRFSK